MKKYLIWMVAALAALVSCEKENPAAEEKTEAAEAISFHLTARHADDTRVVKNNWESGDAIFVFFDNVAAPKFLKMTFDGSEWTSAEFNGQTQEAGALGLKNGDTGTMRAVFLPFGSNATVSAEGTSFVFNQIWYTYYLTGTLTYTVTDHQVSGAFAMTIPEGYVQFFIGSPNTELTHGAYTMGCDAIIPCGVASISEYGEIVEDQLSAGSDMVGYGYGINNYDQGYLFSGKLNPNYHFAGYYFARTQTSDNKRADYVVTGKTLQSHQAVRLPNYNDSKWIEVGPDKTVTFRAIRFATCNVNANVPEDIGRLYRQIGDGYQTTIPQLGNIPEKIDYEALVGDFSLIWLSVHGKEGLVFKYNHGSSFMFMPKSGEYWADCWTSTSDCAVKISSDSGGSFSIVTGLRATYQFLTRRAWRIYN